MTADEGSTSRWRRYFFGRPARWQGIAWSVFGLLYIGLAVAEPSRVFWWVIGGFWLVLGVSNSIIAFSDYRHGRGRYAPPVPSAPPADD